jgi:putative colanic acid biosynthesis UDP-glucose lipid carrier transferase
MTPMSAVAEPAPAALEVAPGRLVSSGAKRFLDFAIALAILAFTAPLLGLVAVLIIVDSRGPVLFRQRRTGLGGREFQIFKFRSMRVMEDGHEVRQASKKDTRVTRVGGFLRRSSIDELPQLFNVLRGDMSLVGPRPHAVSHDREFAQLVPGYAQRFRAKPGLTGLAQVKGLRGEIRSLQDIAQRSEWDNAYVERWSLFLDVQILATTFVILPFQRGAY